MSVSLVTSGKGITVLLNCVVGRHELPFKRSSLYCVWFNLGWGFVVMLGKYLLFTRKCKTKYGKERSNLICQALQFDGIFVSQFCSLDK